MKSVDYFFGFKETKKLFKIINQKEKSGIYLTFFLMVISSLIEMFSIGSIIPLINSLLDQNNNQKILEFFTTYISNSITSENLVYFCLLIILIFFLLKYVFFFIYTLYTNKVILSLKANLVDRLFSKYLKKNYLFHLDNNSALLIRNIQTEISVAINNFLSPLLTFLLSLITLIFITILLLFYAFVPSLIIIFTFGIISILLNLLTRKPLNKIGKQRQIHSLGILQNLQQGFSMIKEIKMSKKENFILEKFNKHNFAMITLGIKKNLLAVLPKVVYEFTFIMIIVFSIYLYYSEKNSMTYFISILAVFALASFRIIPSLNVLSSSYQKIKFGSPALDVLLKEFNSNDVLNKKENYLEIKSDFNLDLNEKIELKNVSFSYIKQNKEILNKINLSILKNSKIGIVGANASGKSTLINILCGLLEPSNGEMLIDGVNINKINVHKWFNQIGYVTQNVYLLDDTVLSNVAFGINEKEIDYKKIENLMNFSEINKSLNIDTLVGEGGKNISGGQKQKISIMRALYSDPEVLVLDEATNAMDKESEINIMEKICSDKFDKTVVIISHNLKSLKNCDFIYNLDNGTLKKLTN